MHNLYCRLSCCTMHLQFANYGHLLQNNAEYWSLSSIVWKNRMHQRQPQSRFCQEFHYQLFLWRNAKAEIWSVSFFQWTRIIKLLFNIRYVLSCSLIIVKWWEDLTHTFLVQWNYLLSLLQDEYHVITFILHAGILCHVGLHVDIFV